MHRLNRSVPRSTDGRECAQVVSKIIDISFREHEDRGLVNAKHLTTSGHQQLTPGKAFQMILWNCNLRLLALCRVLRIKRLKPSRGAQNVSTPRGVPTPSVNQSISEKHFPEFVYAVCFSLCCFSSHSNVNSHILRAWSRRLREMFKSHNLSLLSVLLE